MNTNDYKNPQLLDNLIQFLNPPNIEEKGKAKVSAGFWGFGSKLFTNVTRITNKAFADGVWYDEAKARQVLLDYINNPECTKLLNPQHEKIIQIYDRLAHLSKGEGTWADGIDKELLLEKEPEATVEEDLHLPQLHELILDEVFVPDSPEEQVFEKQESLPKEYVVDPRGQSYIFTRQKGLKPPTQPMLFHIQADEFGSSSELEGGKSKETVAYLHAFLCRSNSHSCPDSVIEQLGEAISIEYDVDHHHGLRFYVKESTEATVLKAQEKISKAFENNKPLLIMGGWIGKPSGHAIYYEIIPESDKKATFRLYNTGAGIGSHQRGIKGHKIKYQVYDEWKGIDRKNLESPLFLEALYELNSYDTVPENYAKTDYQATDIYQGLRSLLQPKVEAAGPQFDVDEALLMTPQRSGVCSWRSLMAFMRTKMGLNDYKRFKCDIKLQSLLDYIEAHPYDVDPMNWRLVKKSHQNLCRSIVKLHQKKLVGDPYIQKAEEELTSITTWIKNHSDCRYKRSVEEISTTYLPCTEDRVVENKHAFARPLDKMKKDEMEDIAGVQPCQYALDFFRQIDTTNPKTIDRAFEKLLVQANSSWEQHDDLALHKGLIDFVTTLEMDEEFWTQAINGQPQMAEKWISHLGEISQLFTKSCFTVPEGHIIYPEKIYLFYKVLHLQGLICRLSHPTWKNLTLVTIDFGQNSLFLNFPNAKMQREMEEILSEAEVKNPVTIDKYSYQNQNSMGSARPSRSEKDIGLDFKFNKGDKKPLTPNFQDFLHQEYPEVIATIAKEESGFKELPKFAQDARIYASSRLPTWVQAMRDTQLASYHIKESSVGPLASLDRMRDLALRFQIDDKEKVSIVTVTLTGVNSDILKVPEVDSIRKRDYLRYAGQYRKIASPAIQQFINFILSRRIHLKEKVLVNTDAKECNIDMADEEFKELARLFTNGKLQHIETLEYFTKHPEKLQDTDYQTLLNVLLFQIGLLDKNLAIQGFGDSLAHFIQQNYEHFSEENEIQPAVFLLKLAHQLSGFCPEQDFYQHTIENLKALLNRKDLEDDVKSLVYAELIAELSHKESLTEDEIGLLITGSIYIKENQPHSKYPPDPFTQKEVSEALLIHANKMRTVLMKESPNQQLLNSIKATLRPNLKGEVNWVMKEVQGEFPFFATVDGSLTLYPLISQLVSKDAQALLPLNIRQNPLFRQLFPKIEKGSLRPGNVYAFNDSYGRKTLVCLKGDHLVVEQKQEGEWVCFVPSTTLLFETKDKTNKTNINSLLGSRYLAQQYTHWRALKPSHDKTSVIYAIDPKSGQRQHVFMITTPEPSVVQEKLNKKNEDQIEELKKKHTNKYSGFQEFSFKEELKGLKKNGLIREEVIDPNNSYFEIQEVRSLQQDMRLGKPSSLFASFEDPSYIHEWYDLEGNLKKIELPRFNLSFRPSPQNSKILICEQFPTYMLNTTESVKKLGVHHHYILIEDANKRRKLILPQQNLKAPEKKEVLLPRYELDRCLKREELDPQKYFVFDVQKNETLFSKSREANLYLAEVLTAAQEYNKAAYYLKRFGSKLSAYTPQESQILKNLAGIDQITGDKSGNGTILQLYAGFLRFKNSLSHHQELPDDEVEAMEEHYDRYINHYHSVTVFKLQSEEEVFLLKTFLSKEFNPLYYLRLKELDPLAAQKLEIPVSIILRDDEVKSLKGFTIPERFKGDYYGEKPRTHTLLTRPQEEMSRNFLYFYELARNGSENEKQRLKASLPFVREIENGRHAGMANFFEAVLNNPNVFPDPLHESDYINLNKKEKAMQKWQSQLQILAENELAKSSTEQLVLQPSDKNIPEDFYLAKKKHEKLSVKLKLALPTLSTFAEDGRSYFKEASQENKRDVGQLFSLLDSCHSKDPVQNREVDRLEKDLEVYIKEPSPPTFTITEEGLTKVKEILEKDKIQDKETLLSLEEQILTLANKNPKSPAKVAEVHLKKWGKLSKVITLEELIISFSQNDFSQLLERNPALMEDDFNQLAEKVGTFLLYATRDQQRMRVQETVNKLEKCKPEERNDLVNQLAERMLVTRMYDPLERPTYLVFEYFANITMRSSQVEKLEKFLSGGEPNLVMEMIMGSGKSKVLLPLLGLLRADGETLSMLIVPQPLFESISQDTQTILQGFSQSLAALHFDRHTKFTKERLEAIYDELKGIRENRECLIMTSKSVQCLLIKFVEEYSNHLKGGGSEKELSVELQFMRKILNLLSESGYPIIDEADTVLNILHEVSFSGGNNIHPKPHELELISGLFELIYSDPKLKSLARVESDPNANEEAPVLTEQLYMKRVQLTLANAIVNRLGQMTFESKPLTKKLNQLIGDLNKETRGHLLHYLCRDKDNIKSAQQFFNSLDEDVQDIIALAGEQVSHLLPYTLTRICYEKYGLDDKSGDPLAIPFSASQTPNSGSQFSNPHITMNYTFQTYMKKGVTSQMVEKQVELLQEKAMREIVASGGKIAIKETEAGKAFAKLKGNINMPFFNYKPANIEDLTKRINESPQAKLFFVSNIILPQLEQFEYKMSCNPQNLVSFFLKAAGFTGTLWNGVSMHHTLKPEPAIGTDAKTLTVLWENSRNNAVTIKEGSIEEILGQLNNQSVSFDMISDAGGYFKEGSNSEMAHKIAAIQGKEVVFYNALGEQTITDGANEVPLSQTDKQSEKRLTFLDQSHTTGADVPQKLDAISIVTIGRNMLLRDLLQSVWRLRGLDKSQRIRFIVSEEVAGIIRQKLSLEKDHPIQLETILKFVIANQASQQGRDNYKALKEGFSNIMQKILLEVLLNEKLTPTARLHAFTHLHSTWIKPASFSSRELYGTLTTEMDGEKVVDLDKKQYATKIDEVFEKMPWLEKMGITKKSCLQELDLIVANIKDYLPAKLQVPTKEIEDDQTVEVERDIKTETETERETQLEVQESTQKEKVLINEVASKDIQECESLTDAIKIIQKNSSYSSSDNLTTQYVHKTPIFPLKSYLQLDQNLSAYASAFDGIHIAINVLEWTDRKHDYKLLGSRRTDFHHLLVKDSKVTLLSQAEAELYRDSPDYYNLTLGFNDSNKKLSQDEQFKIVKLKFLNGECQFTPNELKLLKLWLKSQGAKKMQKLFLEHILKGYPKKTARYQNSSLQNLFAEM